MGFVWLATCKKKVSQELLMELRPTETLSGSLFVQISLFRHMVVLETNVNQDNITGLLRI